MVNNDTRPSMAHQWDVSIGGNAAGEAVVVWRDARNDQNDIYAQRLRSSGLVGTNFKVSDNASWGDQIFPSVLVHDDGSFR